MKEWIEFKRTFTQAQEDALWQYFIDHSVVQDNGYLGIMFYVRDVNDFWRRVHARHTGDFQRYSKLQKQFTQNKKESEMSKIRQLKRTKSVTKRIAYWLYTKLYDYLFCGKLP